MERGRQKEKKRVKWVERRRGGQEERVRWVERRRKVDGEREKKRRESVVCLLPHIPAPLDPSPAACPLGNHWGQSTRAQGNAYESNSTQ